MNLIEAGEVDRNYDAFVGMLPGLVPLHAGKFALMHKEKVVDFFDTSLDATLIGMRQFGHGGYSVQEVADEPEHLGFYSYVGGSGPY